MTEYKYPVYVPYISEIEKRYVNQALEEGWISSKGRFISEFERTFAEFVGAKYATSVFNGTVALHLALMVLGIKEEDEVIVPTFTYIASVNCLKYVGAKPVFVDSLEKSLQMDPEDVKHKITSKTKAIMVVHLYGQPVEMDAIMKIARENNLLIIEDCAESLGATYKNKQTGSFGDAAAFSFFGNKTITTGEGGMVLFKKEKHYRLAANLKSQGLTEGVEYHHDKIGYNFRMTNIQAAIGLAQLERINEIIDKKRQIASWYFEGLNGKNGVTFNKEISNTLSSYWMCTIMLKSRDKRDKMREHLKERGIETRPTFYPIHSFDMYKTEGVFPIAENIAYRGINLPSYPSLNKENVDYIVQSILSYYPKNSN